MVLFDRLFVLFDRNKPHIKFLDLYSRLNALASEIKKEMDDLREIQEAIAGRRIELAKKGRLKGRPAGGVGLSKTKVMKEEAAPELESLVKKTEERFIAVAEKTEQEEPFSPAEELELKKVIELLEKAKKEIRAGEAMEITGTDLDKLRAIEFRLKKCENLLREFYEAQKYTAELARQVQEHEVSPIIKRVFREANPANHFSATISKDEFKVIKAEAAKINACQDPKWKIVWRSIFGEPKPEIDKATGITEPHVNTTIILNGKKKVIHLILKAA